MSARHITQGYSASRALRVVSLIVPYRLRLESIELAYISYFQARRVHVLHTSTALDQCNARE